MDNMPWAMVKIAFDCIEFEKNGNFSDTLWKRYGPAGTHIKLLPKGWDFIEEYHTPIAEMAIFVVDVVPTTEDGEKVLNLLRRCK